MREGESIVGGAPSALHFIGHQRSVRQGRHLRWEGGNHLAGGLLSGGIQARKPGARIFVLPLGPRLKRSIRVPLVRSPEVEPAGWPPPVVDGHPPLLPPAPPTTQLDLNSPTGA